MKKLVYLFAAVAITACSGGEKASQTTDDQPEKRNPDLVYVDSVAVDTVNNVPVLRQNGEVFSGEVWNDDESICQTFHNGQMVKTVLFHSPGHPAAVLEVDGVTFYDEDGNEIEPRVFFARYRAFAEAHSDLPINMPVSAMPSSVVPETPMHTPPTPPAIDR